MERQSKIIKEQETMLEEFDKRLKKAKLYGEDLCIDVDEFGNVDVEEDDEDDTDGFDDIDVDKFDDVDEFDNVDEDDADEVASNIHKENEAKIAELERRLKGSKKNGEDVFVDIDRFDVDEGDTDEETVTGDVVHENGIVDDDVDEDGVDGDNLNKDDLDEDRNALLEYPLPTINPFLVVAKMESNKSAKMSYEDAEKAVGQSMEELLAQTSSSTLKIAGDNGYFDINSEKARERAALRRITGALFVRYHFITDHQIADLIIPARFQDNSVGRHMWRKLVLQWQTNFQSSIMKIYLQALRLTVERTGGVDL